MTEGEALELSGHLLHHVDDFRLRLLSDGQVFEEVVAHQSVDVGERLLEPGRDVIDLAPHHLRRPVEAQRLDNRLSLVLQKGRRGQGPVMHEVHALLGLRGTTALVLLALGWPLALLVDFHVHLFRPLLLYFLKSLLQIQEKIAQDET